MEKRRDLALLRERRIGEVGGVAVGFAQLTQPPWIRTGWLFAQVVVDPGHRLRGYGRRLEAWVMSQVAERSPQGLESLVSDRDPPSRAWAERRGFRTTRHQFESVLELGSFEAGEHEAALARTRSGGVDFLSLAQAPGARRRLYELWAELYVATPERSGHPPLPYEQFRAYYLDNPRVPAEGILIAAVGDEWVGLSGLQREKPGELLSWITGVKAPYRRRGIARSLKILSAEYARRQGASILRTQNDSRNQAMSAILRELGFRRRPGIWWLERSLV